MKMMDKLKVALFVLLLAGAFTACSDDDTPAPAPVVPDVEVEESESDEPTAEELAELAMFNKFAAASSVIRPLAVISELPDNWENMTFEPKVGEAQDAANPDVRKMMAQDADDARSYFISIVPDEGLQGDSWSHEGVGSIAFRAVNEANCYAVMDVNLVHMPGLKQIRFVNKESLSDNKFWGTPYYRVGDILEDKKKTLWLCVRPAGGPNGKDYAHFVSFDPKLIKYKTVSQKLYHVDKEGNLNKKDKLGTCSWTYATNLVEERVAIWTGHVLSMLYGTLTEHTEHYVLYEDQYDTMLQNAQFDVYKLCANYEEREEYRDFPKFAIAYGKPVSNKYTKKRQEKLLQPYLTVTHGLSASGKITEMVQKVWHDPDNSGTENSPYLYSMTTDYDPLSYQFFTGIRWGVDGSFGRAGDYDAEDYLIDYQYLKGIEQAKGRPFPILLGSENMRVLLMTELYIKDHGKENKDFTLVSGRSSKETDYWRLLRGGENFERVIMDEKHESLVVEDLCQ